MSKYNNMKSIPIDSLNEDEFKRKERDKKLRELSKKMDKKF